MIFDDRRHAGRLLGRELRRFRAEDPLVLGLPRGGVPVADEVARALDAPLDVIVVRKLGVPFQPELGMGAIGEGGVRVLNPDIVRAAHVSEEELQAVERRERRVVEDRAERYRKGRGPLSLAQRSVIIVDDGIATGGTVRAAIGVARALGAARVIVAAPVAAADTVRALQQLADEVVVLEIPEWFGAVGAWYRNFGQTSDEEVVAILDAAAARGHHTSGATHGFVTDDEVRIPADGRELGGHLTIPDRACGVVVFAHGSGSSRHSPRNRSVATVLNDAGIATLLFDLLTEDEASDRRKVFDIPLLARRLELATEWLQRRDDARGLRVGYFGASTGAAAALTAAASPTSSVAAVVSRGGRPDLAMEHLPEVRAPTLLIVGGHDELVLDLNRQAAARLQCPHRVVVVPGATHLFEEPGALDTVSRLARDWFLEHLQQPTHETRN